MVTKRTVELKPWSKTEIGDGVHVITGTVISDDSCKFLEGWHCRSTPVVKSWISEDGAHVFETKNSFYKCFGPGDSDPVAKALGAKVVGLFY